LVANPEGKRPLGRPRPKWIDNIKMDVLDIGFGGVDLIGLAQDRFRWRALVNAVMNLRVQYNAEKLPRDYLTGGLLSGAQLHSQFNTCDDSSCREGCPVICYYFCSCFGHEVGTYMYFSSEDEIT
jgi:hypothetical protein